MKYQLLEYESLTRTLRVNKMKNILCLCYMYRYSTVIIMGTLYFDPFGIIRYPAL